MAVRPVLDELDAFASSQLTRSIIPLMGHCVEDVGESNDASERGMSDPSSSSG